SNADFCSSIVLLALVFNCSKPLLTSCTFVFNSIIVMFLTLVLICLRHLRCWITVFHHMTTRLAGCPARTAQLVRLRNSSVFVLGGFPATQRFRRCTCRDGLL